jgi:hypothetical protein
MKMALAALGAMLGGSSLAATLLIEPTVTQIDPALATVCSNDGPASTAAANTVDNGYLAGIASFQGFACKLRVHAGRGPGVRIFSGCADVVWDMQGAIVSVTPTKAVSGYTITCP